MFKSQKEELLLAFVYFFTYLFKSDAKLILIY